MENKGVAFLERLAVQCVTIDEQYSAVLVTLNEAHAMVTCEADKAFIADQFVHVTTQSQANAARFQDLTRRVARVTGGDKKRNEAASARQNPSQSRSKEHMEMESFCKQFPVAGIDEVPKIKAWLRIRSINFDENRTDQQWIHKLAKIRRGE